MKVYFEAGLKDLACKSGFRAETLTSLGKASNFQCTHRFLMPVREAFYEVLMISFYEVLMISFLMISFYEVLMISLSMMWICVVKRWLVR